MLRRPWRHGPTGPRSGRCFALAARRPRGAPPMPPPYEPQEQLHRAEGERGNIAQDMTVDLELILNWSWIDLKLILRVLRKYEEIVKVWLKVIRHRTQGTVSFPTSLQWHSIWRRIIPPRNTFVPMLVHKLCMTNRRMRTHDHLNHLNLHYIPHIIHNSGIFANIFSSNHPVL